MKLNPKTSRVLELYQLFRSGAAINKQEFADRYGVNPRSVQRDIDTIRDFLANQTRSQGVIQSIDYDKATNTYKLVSQDIEFLTNGEMLAICKILMESRAFTKDKITSLLSKILSLCVLPTEHEQIKEDIASELFCYSIKTALDFDDLNRSFMQLIQEHTVNASNELALSISQCFMKAFTTDHPDQINIYAAWQDAIKKHKEAIV